MVRVLFRGLVVALALAAGIGVAGGCDRHMFNRDDLTVDLAKHHIDLRWGRLENAAQRVNPAMRGPFLQVWSKRLANLELQDMDVTGVAMIDEDTAEVMVAVTYVDKETMGVKTVQLPERWVRTDEGWRLATVAELPDGGSLAAPDAPSGFGG